MALTLIEAAKTNSGNVLKQAIIELYAKSSEILQYLPFETIEGNALQYNREETLPGIGFRGVNEGYTASNGIINPVTETLKILGGELDVDNFILKTMGNSRRAADEAMKVKALALSWTKSFIKGDNTTDPKELSGLQARIAGDQVISAGTTAGGAALSLEKLDELIDSVDNPTHLIMNKTLRRKLSKAARDTSVGGYVSYTLDNFGQTVMKYNGVPILLADKDNTNTDILGFTEAADSGDSTATSIYCVSLDSTGVCGIESSGGIDVKNIGELETKPAQRTRVEWYAGLAIFKPRAAARLKYIGNLDVTV